MPNSLIIKYEADIQKYFSQSNITKESFLGSKKWPNTLLYIVYRYLLSLSHIETATGQDRRDLTMPSSNDPSLPYFYEAVGKDLYMAHSLLEKIMDLLSISVNELRQKLGREVIWSNFKIFE